MEYIYLSLSDIPKFVVPIMISVIVVAIKKEDTEPRVLNT